MKLLHRLSAIFDRTNDGLTFLAAIFLAFITSIVSAEIVMRYLLNRSIKWVIEVSEYSLLWVAFLSVAWALRKEAHVKMDVVLSHLKPRTQALLNVITSIVGAIICLTLAWFSAETTWHQFLMGAAREGMLQIPKAPIMAIIPIGFFFLFIQFIKRSYGYLRSWKESPEKS